MGRAVAERFFVSGVRVADAVVDVFSVECLFDRFLSCFIVRADFLANVATKNSAFFFDYFSEVIGNGAFVFYCLVGDTAVCVYYSGGDYCFCGTGVDAAGAVAAE